MSGLIFGCQKSPENLASQIGPVSCTIGPTVTGTGEAVQEARFKFRNNGPVPVAVVYAKIDAYDATGAKTRDSMGSQCIFVSETPAQRLQPGQEYENPKGDGFLLYNGNGPIVRVEAVAVEAADKNDVEPH